MRRSKHSSSHALGWGGAGQRREVRLPNEPDSLPHPLLGRAWRLWPRKALGRGRRADTVVRGGLSQEGEKRAPYCCWERSSSSAGLEKNDSRWQEIWQDMGGRRLGKIRVTAALCWVLSGGSSRPRMHGWKSTGRAQCAGARGLEGGRQRLSFPGAGADSPGRRCEPLSSQTWAVKLALGPRAWAGTSAGPASGGSFPPALAQPGPAPGASTLGIPQAPGLLRLHQWTPGHPLL